MEETGATNPKYVPAFVGFMAPICVSTLKTILLAPIHSLIRQIVPPLYQQSLI